MANASARRSFFGPLQTPPPVVRPPATGPSRPFARVEPGAGASAVGRAVLRAARAELPRSAERERVLAGVLAALQGLTRAHR